MSTESIASSSSPSVDGGMQCVSCQAPLADDQRYCLECGERRVPHSEFLLAGPPPAGGVPEPQSAPPLQPPGGPPAPPRVPPGGERGSTLTVIAGVGVLLLAMGVGVLIGRSGSTRQSAAPTQVISVASSPASGSAGSGAVAETPFNGDWPSATSGYTVQLQTLPQAGTTVSAVEAAKAAAGAKGAKAVGALKSEEFSSLPAGSYVIYAGIDHKRSEATKALASLKKSFPGAKVIKVSNGGGSGSSSSSSEPSSSSPGGIGTSENKPAPPSVLEGLKKTKGKSYEEKSKNLPDVVSTG
jgi:hypothetical protein